MLTLRGFCEQNVPSNLTDDDWEFLESVERVLSVFYKVSIKLQCAQCTLSDFFGYWAFAKKSTEKNNDLLSREILNQMNHYNAQLMENPALLGSVYMDARYQRMLTRDQKVVAIAYLTELHKRIIKIDKSSDGDYATNDIPPRMNSEHNSFAAEMDGFLDEFDIEEETIETDIEEKLRNLKIFSKESSLSPLTYWRSKKMENQDLYWLAVAIHSIPPTQTTVERAFSALSIILNCLRTSLSDESLQNILLLRLNPDVYQKIV